MANPNLAFRGQWSRTGSLYSLNDEAAMEADIRTAMDLAFGEPAPCVHVGPDLHPDWVAANVDFDGLVR